MSKRFRKGIVLLLLMSFALVCGCGTPPVEVFDGANNIYITPYSNIPVSDLSEEDFIADVDGYPVYKGGNYTMIRGVDVSQFQGDIDWNAVADAGYQFAIIRCGYRGATEGTISGDENYETNIAEARESGLKVGVYFYSQAITMEEAKEEADFVLEKTQGVSLDLPVMFDWERNDTETGSRTLDAGGDVITDCGAAFCREITRAGLQAGIYMNLNTGYHTWDLGRLADYTIWLSNPGIYPQFYYKVDCWQYSFTGSVPGIEGECDLNYYFAPNVSTE